MPELVAWPFLVAAGRRRDYSILLAPDFLVDAGDFGILDQVARPTADDGRPTIVRTRTRGGRPLTVVYATHELTDVTDEHGRPLRLIYGFVTQYAVTEPSTEDLRYAYQAGLVAYQRFLADEEAMTVTPGPPFPARTPAAARPATSVSAAVHKRRPVSVAVGIAAAALLVTAVVAVLGLSRPDRSEPSPCPTATTADRVGRQPSPTASPSCPSGPGQPRLTGNRGPDGGGRRFAAGPACCGAAEPP